MAEHSDLSDDELEDRLLARGVPARVANRLVQGRDHPSIDAAIDEALNA